MKLFIKCLSCGFSLYTDRKEVLALLLDRFVCNECKHPLTLVSVLMCDRDRGDWCSSCQHRFQCFSSEPIGKA
jgi:hypothetical protein